MARYNRPTPSSNMSVNPTEENNMSTDTANTEVESIESIEAEFETEAQPIIEATGDELDDELSDSLEDDEDDDELDEEDEDDDEDEDEDEDDAPSAEDKAAAEEAARQQAEKLATDFGEQVAEIVGDSEGAKSGNLEPEAVTKIVALYQGVPGVRAKGLARQEIENTMYLHVGGDNLQLAKVYMNLIPELKAAAPAKASRPVRTLSPEEQFLYWGNQVATLDLARQLLVIPDEVRDLDKDDRISELAEKAYSESYADAEEYIAFLKGEGPVDPDTEKLIEPDVPDFVKAAAKLALGKGVSSRKGKRKAGGSANAGPRAPRRKPRTHIEQVFAELPVGTFLKVGEIANAKSAEYGDDAPSQGAIASNLSNENFVTPWLKTTEEDGYLGAKKIAEAA